MATSNLGLNKTVINSGKDSIVIVNCLGDIPGGRTLDVTGVADDVISAGHVIIRTSAGEYAPLGTHEANSEANPAVEAGYDALPEGAAYIGVLKHSVLKSEPRASIMTMGQVNAAACAYASYINDTIKAGLPNIQFLNV